MRHGATCDNERISLSSRHPDFPGRLSMFQFAEATNICRRAATAILTSGLVPCCAWSAWAQTRRLPDFSFVVVSDTHLDCWDQESAASALGARYPSFRRTGRRCSGGTHHGGHRRRQGRCQISAIGARGVLGADVEFLRFLRGNWLRPKPVLFRIQAVACHSPKPQESAVETLVFGWCAIGCDRDLDCLAPPTIAIGRQVRQLFARRRRVA